MVASLERAGQGCGRGLGAAQGCVVADGGSPAPNADGMGADRDGAAREPGADGGATEPAAASL